jgi:hypothetical protein
MKLRQLSVSTLAGTDPIIDSWFKVTIEGPLIKKTFVVIVLLLFIDDIPTETLLENLKELKFRFELSTYLSIPSWVKFCEL